MVGSEQWTVDRAVPSSLEITNKLRPELAWLTNTVSRPQARKEPARPSEDLIVPNWKQRPGLTSSQVLGTPGDGSGSAKCRPARADPRRLLAYCL